MYRKFAECFRSSFGSIISCPFLILFHALTIEGILEIRDIALLIFSSLVSELILSSKSGREATLDCKTSIGRAVFGLFSKLAIKEGGNFLDCFRLYEKSSNSFLSGSSPNNKRYAVSSNVE
jgi:hypothetical protein